MKKFDSKLQYLVNYIQRCNGFDIAYDKIQKNINKKDKLLIMKMYRNMRGFKNSLKSFYKDVQVGNYFFENEYKILADIGYDAFKNEMPIYHRETGK